MAAVIKWLLYLLLGAVLLGALGFAIALLPAHLQIRSVAVNIPTATELDSALDTISAADYPAAIYFVNTARQNTMWGELGHVGVLLQWPDGKSFLIDTGMNPAEAVAFGRPLELLGAGPTETFGSLETQLGSALGNITGIGFTHLHKDHVASIARLCAAMTAPATIFQSAQQAGSHNLHTRAGQSLVNESTCNQQQLESTVVKAVPGFPGLFAIAAGGHTPGSTLFITRLGSDTWIFAGDITNAMVDIYTNQDKGFMYSYLLIPEDTDVLADWRQWLKAQDARDGVNVLVAHDIRAFSASGLQAWAAENGAR